MSLQLAVLDPGSGNLPSLIRALKAAAEANGQDVVVNRVASAQSLGTPQALVVPGQGHFGDVTRGYRAAGLWPELEAAWRSGLPYLGVCVGMQMMLDGSEEDGWHEGLGWFSGICRRLKPERREATAGETTKTAPLKVPHMGWNALSVHTAHPVLGAVDGAYVYFVHSYAGPAQTAAATVDYGGAVAAAYARDHVLGVQFHPEKSQRAGLKLLSAWLEGLEDTP